nr:putative disease resistance protein At3g14460 [Malus domestica]
MTSCDSLIYFTKFQIPQNLRRIEIRECKNLKSLVDEEAVGSSWSSYSHSCLEYLFIDGCESLTSLSLSGQLLRTLKHLQTYRCKQLELIAEDGSFNDNTNHCLEYIEIWNCQNLKSLPDGLCHLSNLQKLHIERCGSLVSIPRLSGGRRPSNLRNICIIYCEKLEALPEDMHNLNSVEELRIDYHEGLTFPPNLTLLHIWKVKSCKSLWELEWGLHRLTFLSKLGIYGDDPGTMSFPPDMVRMETLLPKSLAHLSIHSFPNLKKLSGKGFQFLTSLQSLRLWNCPKLASIPDEGLPPSLTQLWISGCPVLKERCQPGKGHYWHKISHIPSIQI